MVKKEASLPGWTRKLNKCHIPKSDWSNIRIHENQLYIFDEVPHHQHYFDLLKPFREELISAFWGKINKWILREVNTKRAPEIAVHIRLGDFKNIPWTQYKWDWYERLFADLRANLDRDVRITIFSDGRKKEIPLFKNVKNLSYFNSGNDLVDLLYMSKSKILVTYPGSSYSMWAGFIGESILIHQYDTLVRNGEKSNLFEGNPYDENNNLINNLCTQLSFISFKE